MISDHSTAVITIPKGLRKKRKSFRFVNYIDDKKDFIECVKREWETYVIGCNMYKVGQKLKRSKKLTANTSGNKKKGVKPTKEVSNSNPFDVLNSVENDGDLGTNGETLYLASNGANSNGSLFWNVKTSNDDGKPMKKIDYPGDHDSEDEVESVDNDMARSMALEKKDPDVRTYHHRMCHHHSHRYHTNPSIVPANFGTKSLLEQWRDSYENGDYDEDPYDDDMYEGQDFPHKI
ncbi:hypothetical protein Tco_1075822 [Tanacetum coccineum]